MSRRTNCSQQALGSAVMLLASLGGSCSDANLGPLPGEPEPAQQASGASVDALLKFGQVRLVGPGCPKGTVEPRWSPDKRLLRFSFDKFTVSVDATPTSPLETEKECTLEAEIFASDGMKYALTSFSTAAAVWLDPDVVGEIEVEYSLDELPHTSRTLYLPGREPLRGPMNEDYLRVTDEVRASERVWSGCTTDHLFKAQMRLRLTNTPKPKQRGSLALNWADAELDEAQVNAGIAIQPCRPSQ